MIRKNIAVLTTSIDSDSQAAMIKGMGDRAKEHGYNLACFVWFCGVKEPHFYNLGQRNIVHLPDLNLFDGVIVCSSILHMEENRNSVEQVIKDLTCPVVCIGAKMGDCYCLNVDNYAAMYEMVNHLIKVQGKKLIHFVKGVAENADAEVRFQAYVDALTENNIPVVPERISQGDFYIWGGESAAKEILESDLPFPEAIVCANDVMAITILEVLKEKGYRIPEDVMITGYDYISEGQICSPKLTTVRCRFEDLGKAACQVIIDVLAGNNPPKEQLLPDEVVYNNTTGHESSINIDEEERYNYQLFHRKSIHYILQLEKDIMLSSGYEEWLEAMKRFIQDVNPSEFYCCTNEKFQQSVFNQFAVEQENMTLEDKLSYSSCVQIPLAYKDGEFFEKKDFESRYALDELFAEGEQCKTYVFVPLHYLERNYGYMVFGDSKFAFRNLSFISWIIKMGSSIENMRKQNILKNAMQRLDELYVRDSLTGVYNRFGMERYFNKLKEEHGERGTQLQISFADLDSLKFINDNFSHDEGDRIIIAVSKILKKHAGEFCVVRYGGDEFVVLGTVNDACQVAEYWDRVNMDIAQYNKDYKHHGDLSISYGYELFDLTPSTSLIDCVHIADKKMYQVKNKKKERE